MDLLGIFNVLAVGIVLLIALYHLRKSNTVEELRRALHIISIVSLLVLIEVVLFKGGEAGFIIILIFVFLIAPFYWRITNPQRGGN